MEILVVTLLAVVVVALVAYPLVARGRGMDEATLDADIVRYRDALRGGTLCEACLAANPPGSRFCAECGEPLEGQRNAEASS